MTKLRQLWLLTAVGSLAILAGGYFVLVSPKASKAAALREDVANQEQANTRLRSQIAQLNRQKKDLPKLQAELERFAAKIPNNPALPSLIRSLSDAADNAGVDLVSLAPASPVLLTPADPTGATTAATSAAPTLQIAQIPVSVQVAGSYAQISQFLSEVEGLTRAFQVSGLTVKPGAPSGPASQTGTAPTVSDGTLTAQLTGAMYMTTKVAPAAPVTTAASTATTAK
jgi:type IV pilus assembly protein PilO